jgi:hypothetical protein
MKGQTLFPTRSFPLKIIFVVLQEISMDRARGYRSWKHIWAAMAPMHARYPYLKPVSKAVKLVMSRQRRVCRPSVVPYNINVNSTCTFNIGWTRQSKVCLTKTAQFLIIWMLGKAQKYLKKFKGKDGANGDSNGIWTTV